MTSLHEARLLMDIFVGSDLAFGRTDLLNRIKQSGKHETRCWLEKRPVTEEDWRKHVEGQAGLGIPPINSESKVRFGAIDVDEYKSISLEALAADIAASKLPLVLCRSKSGGPHLFLFVSDWVAAADMVQRLDCFAGFFGFGASEIFPKQVTLGRGSGNQHADYGNWINMPYFDRMNKFRYGLDESGKPIESIREFATYVQRRTITVEQFIELKVPTLGMDNGSAFFPDGPPCLNNIFGQRVTTEGMRNILLCNIAIYAKKAHPDTWKDKLDEYNRLFEKPLPNREVETIKRSYQNKEYRYQCGKSPLCDFCNSQVCKSQLHGIDTGDILPNNRSLTVVNTSPPIWYLDISSGETVQRISLNTDELQNPRLFQKRCMEATKTMPMVPKLEDWTTLVQDLLKHVTQIDIPEELSPRGQFLQVLEDFIIDKSSTESAEVMMRGLVFCSATDYQFRLADLMDYLERKRFVELKRNHITDILLNDCKAERGIKKLGRRNCRYFSIARKDFHIEAPTALAVETTMDPF